MSLAKAWPPIALIAVLLHTTPGQAAADNAPRHYELQHTSLGFLSAESAVAIAAYASSWILLKPKTTCKWCQTNSFDDSVRSTLRANDPRAPALVSHALSVVAIPVLGLTGLWAPAGTDEKWRRGLEDTWILANTFILTAAVGDTVKNLVARRRPAFLYQRQRDTEFSDYP